MRVVLDVNVIISILLSSNQQSPPRKIITAFLLRQFTLLLPQEMLEELIRTVSRKKNLKGWIFVRDIERLVSILERFGERLPLISHKIKSISRDPKDDYLLACSQRGQADYLVTGDEDLLVLKEIGSVKIVRPNEFVGLLPV